MKLLRPFFILIFVLLQMTSCQKNTDVQLITPDEYQRLNQLEDVQLIDVRSVEAFQDLHLKGAQNLVYDAEFSKKIMKLDKSKPVAVYCKTGGLSKKCVEILKDSGFVKIFDLKGGLSKWKHSGISIDSIIKPELKR
ncbi:rhodanese-like domain-containing protein [Psychroflexus sp. ALD_RP9]|uniref:rhodanese-like domain-containing protein n=1 Tax=Psychroflexus sp. ALD_RP9 TaxID=2777186 RepID=UPI001F5E0A6C|nr:rhodanese-like domain-containing protein [Psychroflexus sp. ALD_RP9]